MKKFFSSYYPAAAIFFLTIALLHSCKVKYSFTGASIPAEVQTINIDYFENTASLIEPTLAPKLTQKLKDKFTGETNLTLTDGKADLYIKGKIIDYHTSPIAIQEGDQAAQNRLTVKIKVIFTNTYDESKSYDTFFERYQDYSSDQELDAVKDVLLEEITELLVMDIFNKAVINW